MLSVSEMFVSWQGEGFLSGVPSVFVRLAGCHLGCTFCDTTYAQRFRDGERMESNKILERTLALAATPVFPTVSPEAEVRLQTVAQVRHVVLTGGEPFLFRGIISLVASLRAHGFHVTIETSGTRFLPVACDLVSISPKLSNSGVPSWRASVEHALPQLLELGDYQIKFVVDDPRDFEEIDIFLRKYTCVEREKVLLMPQGREKDEISARLVWIETEAQARNLKITTRGQLFWFDSKRGV